MVHVREDREVDDAQRLIATGGRLPVDEVLPDTGGHHHAPGAQSHPDRLVQRRQEIRQPGLPHPVAQVQGVAAVHQQDVCLSDPGDPALFVDAGQRGELQHAQGLPTQFAHGGAGFLSADEPPCRRRTAHGVPVPRGGDAEGVGLGDRFAQEVDQRVVDARVLDAGGREQKLHDALSYPIDLHHPLGYQKGRRLHHRLRVVHAMTERDTGPPWMEASSEPRSALASGSNCPSCKRRSAKARPLNSWPRWREREPSACWPCRGRSPTPSGR